jgi:hypothetical protein
VERRDIVAGRLNTKSLLFIWTNRIEGNRHALTAMPIFLRSLSMSGAKSGVSLSLATVGAQVVVF